MDVEGSRIAEVCNVGCGRTWHANRVIFEKAREKIIQDVTWL